MKTHWTQPQVTEMRFGFEVTMHVMNRETIVDQSNQFVMKK